MWPDGSVHWTRGAARVFRDEDGQPRRMLGTGQDITERRRIEDQRDDLLLEERRAGEFREAFIDVISHELRTPVTTILGAAQILARSERPRDGSARDSLLDDIHLEAERLHRLVEDLLVLTRAERGRLVVDAEPLAVERLLQRVVTGIAPELPSIDDPRGRADGPAHRVGRGDLRGAGPAQPAGQRREVLAGGHARDGQRAPRGRDRGHPRPGRRAGHPQRHGGAPVRAVLPLARAGPRGRRIGHRPVRLPEPGRGHGWPDLGGTATRGWRRIRLHPAHPGRRRREQRGPGAVDGA